jgi:hypothetical protein
MRRRIRGSRALIDIRAPVLDRIGRPRLVAELQAELRRHESPVVRGQLVGLVSGGPAPLRSDAGPLTDTYRAGVLAGSLVDRLLDERGEIDRELVLTAGVYAAAIAQGAVVGAFEESAEPTILKEHVAACIRVERRRGQLAAEDELAFYRWLTGELGMAFTEETLAAYGRMRARRLQRTSGG